jgi:hypothetical protein
LLRLGVVERCPLDVRSPHSTIIKELGPIHRDLRAALD